MAQKTKLDALQKYLTKKVNTTKQVQNQIKIVDYDLEGFDNKKSDGKLSLKIFRLHR